MHGLMKLTICGLTNSQWSDVVIRIRKVVRLSLSKRNSRSSSLKCHTERGFTIPYVAPINFPPEEKPIIGLLQTPLTILPALFVSHRYKQNASVLDSVCVNPFLDVDAKKDGLRFVIMIPLPPMNYYRNCPQAYRYSTVLTCSSNYSSSAVGHSTLILLDISTLNVLESSRNTVKQRHGHNGRLLPLRRNPKWRYGAVTTVPQQLGLVDHLAGS